MYLFFLRNVENCRCGNDASFLYINGQKNAQNSNGIVVTFKESLTSISKCKKALPAKEMPLYFL
jgi:hypothetical protein